MTAHSYGESRRAAWSAELARLRSEVIRCEDLHYSLVQRAGNMRRGGFTKSAQALELRARSAMEELIRARKALERAGGGRT